MRNKLQFQRNYKKGLFKLMFVVAFLFSINSSFGQEVVVEKTAVENANCNQFDITLSIKGDPPPQPQEVVLIIDRSGSMGRGTEPFPIEYAKAAAIDFVNAFFDNDLTDLNKIAIVSFADNASLDLTLTKDDGIETGRNDAIIAINAITAVPGTFTNTAEAIVMADDLLTDNGTFDCVTSRSIILLSDGVPRRNVPECDDTTVVTICQTEAIDAGIAAQTTDIGSPIVTYFQSIFTIALTGTISGAEEIRALDTMDQIQNAGAYATEDNADLSGIYDQILNQLVAAATQLPGEPLVTDTVQTGFSLVGGITTTKGTASISGQTIEWNLENVFKETVTMTYTIEATDTNFCGTSKAGISTINYENSSCVSTITPFNNPTFCVPCPEIIDQVISRSGCSSVDYSGTVEQNGCTPTLNEYAWEFFLDGAPIGTSTSLSGTFDYTGIPAFEGDFSAKLTYTGTFPGNCASKVVTRTANIELIDNDPIISAPTPLNIEGCDENDITIANARYPFSATQSADIKATFTDVANYTASDDGTISSITYIDVITPGSSCPLEITRTFTITDGCSNTGTTAQIININSPAVIVNSPSDASASACTFSDQAAVDAAFSTWLTGFTVSGGCSATGDYGTPSAPILCDGGTTSVTYTVSDLCSPSTVTKTFEVVAPPTTVTINSPADASASTCTFANQAAVDAAFNTWLTGFSVSGGCSASGDYGTPSAPILCDGGTTSVTYTVSDLCSPSTVTKTFEVVAPPTTVTINSPADASASACTFANQAAVDAAFNTWLTGFTVSGGCSASGDYGSPSAPILCDGGTSSVTYTVSDLCNPSTVTKTFEVLAPPAVIVSSPADTSASACTFADQAAVDAAFNAWLTGFAVSGGCSATGDYGSPSAPILCIGGTSNVTYTVSDLCTPSTVTKTFEVVAPPAVIVNSPADTSASACTFTDQAGVDAAFNTWLTGFTVSGGCSATGDYGTPSAPILCDGGTTSVTYTVLDLCSPSTVTKTFEVVAPPTTVTINSPADASASACTFANQAAVDAAFNTWLTGFTVSGGCSATGDYGSPSAPILCDGGTTSVTYNVSDLCNPSTVTKTFEVVAPPTTVTINSPADTSASACTFADQAAVDAAFNTWLTGFTVSGGCSTVGDYGTPAAPVLCTGGITSVTYTVSDLCNPSTVTKTFEVLAPPAVTVNSPPDASASACTFADQAAVDAAFNTWLTGFTVSGGCSTVGDYGTPVAPVLCTGGITSVIYTVSDLCNPSTVTKTFEVLAPPAVIVSFPADTSASACTFADQAAVDAAFSTWLTGFSVSGGCSTTGDYGTPTAPILCVGGTTSVTYSVSDLCNISTVTRTFDVIAPNDVTYTLPSDDSSVAAQFDNTDPAVAQQALDDDIAAWVTAQTAIINSTKSGGCSPVVSHNFTTQSIPFCASTSLTITWTVEDICSTTNPTATYTFTQPNGINFIAPSDDSADSCEFYNADPVAAQNALDDDIAAWVNAQTIIIENSLSGGSPDVTNNLLNQSIDFCTGGSIIITWNIDDICENLTPAATYTLTKPEAVTYTEPIDQNSASCDYTNQGEIDTAFTAWVTAQSIFIAQGGGCNPVLSNNSVSTTIPSFCTGGTATVTWTITDACETINTITADFVVTPADAITYTEPVDQNSASCDYSDQNGIDTAFAAWVTAQSSLIAQGGGCSPVLSNNSNGATIPSLCNGGTTTVTWTIADACETINTITADFVVTPTDAVTYTEPIDQNSASCDYTDQSGIDTAFAAWVTAQSSLIAQGGGCSPILSNSSDSTTIPSICTGGTATVTWTITDACETISNITADFVITPAGAVTFTEPIDQNTASCDFNDQGEIDTAFAAWVTAQSSNIAQGGGCSPVLSNNSDSTSIPSLCAGGTATVTWTITDACETTNNITADFVVTAPATVIYVLPSNDASIASEFDDPVPAVAQANLDADIAAWVAAQTDIINDNLSGGCSPTVTNNFLDQSISFCGSSSITITWTVEDICRTTNPTATYQFTQPDGMKFTSPVENTVNACQFDNTDPVAAQNALDADIAAWVAAQTAIINNTITGGSPTVSNDYVNQSIDFCKGGSISITWALVDICQILTPTATYTVTPPEVVAYTAPFDDIAASCEFDNADPVAAQNALDSNIEAWVAIQTAIINDSLTGGCSPSVTNDFLDQSIAFCTGGSVTINWTIEDICGTTNNTATYTLTKPDVIGYTAPVDKSANACTFDNSTPERAQAALNAGISSWVTAQTTIIQGSFTGGCSPSVLSDFNNQSIDFCSGGSVTITWTIEDICGTATNPSATYTYTPPSKVKFDPVNLPQNMTVECDAIPNPISLTASTNCGNVKVTYNQERINGICANGYVLKRTWKSIDICGTQIAHVQEITVQDTKAPELTTNYDSLLTVSCADIPDAPSLVFSDNCSTNLNVEFDETSSFDDRVYADYKIIRTWKVTDECGNNRVYSQELNVRLDEIVTEITAADQCFDDGIIDLNQFLSGGKINGNWEMLEGKTEAILTGSIFDPTVLEFAEDFLPQNGGIDYLFRYTGLEDGCINITEVTININADCKVLPCGSQDVNVTTAITPNDDNKNETFDIGGIDLCGFNAEVKVFNRWGAIVYESNTYQIGEGLGGWGGKSHNASLGASGTVPNGTYYYIITVKDNIGVIGTYTGPVYIGTK